MHIAGAASALSWGVAIAAGGVVDDRCGRETRRGLKLATITLSDFPNGPCHAS